MFRKILATAALLLSCLLAPAAASAADYTPEALHGTTWPLTSRMRIELQVSNRHIDMHAEYGGGFGGNVALAYGMARATRKVADRQVASLREAFGEFPLEQVLTEALEQRLDRSLFATEFDIVSVDLTQGQEFRYRDQKPGLRILEIRPFFGFSAEGDQVMVMLATELQDRKSVDRRTRAFRLLSLGSIYAFQDDSLATVEKPRERMPLWQQRLDRDRALKLLQEGANGAVEQLNTLLRLHREQATRGDNDARGKPAREGEANGRRWRMTGGDGNEFLQSVGPLPVS